MRDEVKLDHEPIYDRFRIHHPYRGSMALSREQFEQLKKLVNEPSLDVPQQTESKNHE